MAQIDASSIQPGPQHPDRYPRTGPNYARYGDVAGMVYYYPTDSYYVDPKAVKESYEASGALDKPPGLADTLLPVAAVVGGGALATEAGKGIGASLFGEGAKQAGTGLLSSGGTQLAGEATAGALEAPNLISAARVPGAAAGAAGAEGAATQGAGLLSGPAGTALGVAGVGLGAYGAYEGIKNKDPLTAGIGGAGIGLGLNTLGMALGPVGWAAAIGVPVGMALLSGFGDKDSWKTEKKRLDKLQKNGVNIPAGLLGNMPTRGRSRDELVAIEEQKIAAGQPGNPTFARSRNEADLKPEDIWGYSTFFEKYGNDWLGKYDENQRRQIAQSALDAGAVTEAKGSINIDWGKVPAAEGQAATSAADTDRSKTRSPGIDDKGNRINYGRKK